MFQSSVTVQRRNDDAVRRSVSPHRLIVSSHHCKTVTLNVPILKHALQCVAPRMWYARDWQTPARPDFLLDKVSGTRFQLYRVAMRRGCDEAIRNASPRHRFVAELSRWFEPCLRQGFRYQVSALPCGDEARMRRGDAIASSRPPVPATLSRCSEPCLRHVSI